MSSAHNPAQDLRAGMTATPAADAADLAEQARPVVEEPLTDLEDVDEGWEADPADAAEQRREVPFDEGREHG